MSATSPVEDIFFAALQKPTATERAAFLDAACAGDAGLRARVERLLAAHPHAAGFLDEPAVGAPTRDLPDGGSPTGPLASVEEPGEWAGPYKLLQKLGEGGMGTVWVAEQEQPVKRRVALKLIKPGMDSERVIARFEAERQALALMDHTNIAKVLDAGTTPAGRPYFAMELVKGVPITRYCDELHLSIRERLGLFVDVCRAVQHAHQKGVIHRDIKPTNVLVAIQDGTPVPKVIDFGVAKAVHAKLADRTLFTELGAVIGTPEYMAPEQAELSALDVDTRADVYALGALLYELLTGSTPLTRDRLKAAGLAEVLRLIREEDPPKPSTRLSMSREAIVGLAAKRRTEPRRLGAEVRGELDWIAMRCLEKDRTRRYESASGLARDVERYLADEPVEACPPGAGYRLRKFLRRNRGPALVVALVLAVLLAGIVGTTVGFLRAQANAEFANQNMNRAHRAEDAALNALSREKDLRDSAVRERDRAKAAEAEQAKERARAERERDAKQIALTRSDGLRLGSEAMLARPTNPGLALLLGLEAVRRYPHPLTFNALYDAAADLRETRTIPVGMSVGQFHVSPDGARFLVGTNESTFSDTGAAAVFDAATGKKLAEWRGFHPNLATLDWSPDGTRAVATTVGRATVAFIDGEQPGQATYTDRVAYVWDTATGRDVVHLRRHDDAVVSARFSPDGRKIVTASWDHTARIWDAATGKELHVLRGHERSLKLARFSPDGRRVLTLSAQEEQTAHWRDNQGKPRPEQDPNPDSGITTRPMRSQGLSSGNMGGRSAKNEEPFARLWDAETGKQVAALEIEEPAGTGTFYSFTNIPLTAVYSPDGKRIAVGFTRKNAVGVWDADAGGKPIRLLRIDNSVPLFQQFVSVIAFSPDGKRLAAATRVPTAVCLWDLQSGQLLHRLEGHDRTAINSVRFSKDGERIVSADDGGTARVWDADTGQELAVFRGHTDAVRAAEFFGDRDTVVTAGDRTVRFWSVKPPSPVPTMLTGDPRRGLLAQLLGAPDRRHHSIGTTLTALAYSPDGGSIVTGDNHRTALLWDARTGKPKGAVTEQLRGEVNAAVFAPDGKTVYLGTDVNLIANLDRDGDRDTMLSMVHRWDLTTGKATRFLKGQTTGVAHMALSPDGRRLLVVSTSSGLAFQPRKGDPLYYGHANPDRGEATVWDTATGQLLARLPTERHSYQVPLPQFFPHGKTVLLARVQKHELAIIDAATGEPVRALAVPKDNPSVNWVAAAISPDGRTVAAVKSGGVSEVWFWDAATGVLLGSHRAESAPDRLRFTPDSKGLLVIADRLVLVLDVATRSRVRVLRGHEARVEALAFSPDGSRLLTGSEDRSAILWDVATGRVLSVYKGHPGPVKLVAYSPDGKRVATTSSDNLARVWPVDLLPEFEKRKPRELIPQERDRYELPPR